MRKERKMREFLESIERKDIEEETGEKSSSLFLGDGDEMGP